MNINKIDELIKKLEEKKQKILGIDSNNIEDIVSHIIKTNPLLCEKIEYINGIDSNLLLVIKMKVEVYFYMNDNLDVEVDFIEQKDDFEELIDQKSVPFIDNYKEKWNEIKNELLNYCRIYQINIPLEFYREFLNQLEL